MFNLAALLLITLIGIISSILCYYVGKYKGIMEVALEDRFDDPYRLADSSNNLHRNNPAIHRRHKGNH